MFKESFARVFNSQACDEKNTRKLKADLYLFLGADLENNNENFLSRHVFYKIQFFLGFL